ncbi:MAG: YqeG family HAD IIIA-type phosphatase [Okeania sp. SIO3I5]|uniref:YqeG family HAD IIIA-type phosphatase n=1 Tax=Okeania sp. SIO3I5 TaxID=2607805 RepID=UPI0013B719A9|nr:YqeG family HAD IIIA-type phosphatase [Okeania sp. SIO3I5]NEQ37184.1 YqeG family HAD IIIA-type phosphatase [Okeania sp. SIO3I5]
MSWGKLLQPDLVLGDSILSLTSEIIQKHQIQGLVLDVDETLVSIRDSQASPELTAWVEEIKTVASLWLVSNNVSQYRIGRIGYSLNVPYITAAAKPSRRKLKKAVDAMNLPVEKIAMVGDRLFTDVLAGNRLGMFTILVEPISNHGLEFTNYKVRSLEVWVSQVLGASLNMTTHNLISDHKK